MNNKTKSEPGKEELVEIMPLKDHVIHHNEDHYDIKKGEKISVKKKFLEVLKTEQVIN